QDESKTRSSASSVQVSTDSSIPSSKDNNILLEEWHAPAGFSPDFSLSSKDDSEMSKAQSAISPEIRLEAQLSQDFTFSPNHDLGEGKASKLSLIEDSALCAIIASQSKSQVQDISIWEKCINYFFQDICAYAPTPLLEYDLPSFSSN
ncbi:2057_t:CDS:2, partial [Cetraspora pellucida]